MLMVSLVVGIVATILLLPAVTDSMSLIRAARRRGKVGVQSSLPRFLVLVPAHDEELLIGGCLDSLKMVRYPAELFRAVVIADNCRDRTGEIVRDAGFECLERHDPAFPGKPRAIEWALDTLGLDAFDAVVIIDADTIVDADFLGRVAATAPLQEKAVQGYHDVSNPVENALTRMSVVFAAARYRFAFPLKQRAGLNVPLMGNGMVLGTAVLSNHRWNAFSICEDWELYAQLTAAGVRIETVPEARVYSQEANSLRQSTTQRQRWAAGKITVLLENMKPLLLNPRIGVHQKLDAIAELSSPGPAVHLGLVSALIPVIWLLALPGYPVLSLMLAASLLRLAVYTGLALAKDAQPLRACLAFLFLPFYTVWRLGVQVTALAMVGDRPWIRTQRHAARMKPSAQQDSGSPHDRAAPLLPAGPSE